MNEIRSIRRTILMKDTIYNVQNNKVFQLGVGAIITIAGALIVKERKIRYIYSKHPLQGAFYFGKENGK